MIQIDEEKCVACDLCHKVCPEAIIGKNGEIKAGMQEFCINCGHCYAVCRHDAIIMSYDTDKMPLLKRNSDMSPEAFMLMLSQRRSGRFYKNQPLSREHLIQIIEAASLSPSASNGRSVKAYVYTDAALINQIREKTISAYKKYLRMFNIPSFLLLWKVMGKSEAQYNDFKHKFKNLTQPADKTDPLLHNTSTILIFTVPKNDMLAEGDAWISAQNAVLYAETISVSTCYNGFVAQVANNKPFKHLLGIPEQEKIITVISMGYPSLKFHRQAPRNIMPISWNG